MSINLLTDNFKILAENLALNDLGVGLRTATVKYGLRI